MATKVSITANENATKRTKNRAREHSEFGHRLSLLPNLTNTSLFHKPARLFECSCEWLGWLPLDEIRVENLRGNVVIR